MSDSHAVDHFRRRAGVIGFRAAMLAYVLSKKSSPYLSANFGLWVAEYVFREQMRMFGAQVEQKSRELTVKTDSSRGSVRNLLAALPQTFTTSDLIGLRRKFGQSTEVRRVLSRWVCSGYIRKVGDKTYQKLRAA